MARSDARNVKPSMSADPADKLAAALNWSYGLYRKSAAYAKAPVYYDMLVAWHNTLSAHDQEICRTLADVVGSAHKGAALGMAASLPPAPRCPL